MRKLLVMLGSIIALAIPSAGVAKAPSHYVLCGSGSCGGGNFGSYCYSYELGRLAQDSSGNWYRCTFTGAGPTGYQWWQIG